MNLCKPSQMAGTLPLFCIGALKAANSVGKCNHSPVPTKELNQFATRRKESPPIGSGSCLDFI